MSRLVYSFINKLISNASAPSAPSGSTRGAINRDPKAVKAKRVGYQISNGSAGEAEEIDIDLEAISQAIRTDSYLTQGVLTYQELIFKSGWTLQSKNEQVLDYLKFRLEMMQVATGISLEQLFEGIARDIVWSSNCFIVKARARNGIGLPPGVSLTPVLPSKEPVVGYFLLPPQTISITRDENGTVTGYTQEVEGGGDAIEFKPEDIIHIKTNVRSGAAFGDPWIAPVIEDIRLLRKIEENISLLLYKHIFPVLKYKIGNDEPGQEATDEEIEDVQAMINGMDNDSLFIMPNRHDVDALNINAIDGKPYLDYFENRVFSGMGLSQVDFGRGDTANRNTADAMTGKKADRIKGWQQSLQSAIDSLIIDELLIEGGFDPLVNPEFDVDFVFNEIEQERLIAKENHEIHKFNSNLQSFEETRAAIGKDPTVDESRLHFNMFGNTANEAAQAATENKSQPENQNGKRDGPKRQTESEKHYSLDESDEQTPFQSLLEKNIKQSADTLSQIYEDMKKSVLYQIERRESRNTFPMNIKSGMIRFNQLEQDRLSKTMESHAKEMLMSGILSAHESVSSYKQVKMSVAHGTIRTFITENNKSLEERLKKVIDSRLKTITSEKEVGLAIHSVFKSLQHQMISSVKSAYVKSYNYGYALGLLSADESYASVYYEGECKSCLSRSKEIINLKQFSSLDEIAIFYRIPSWHPNCECELKNVKGG